MSTSRGNNKSRLLSQQCLQTILPPDSNLISLQIPFELDPQALIQFTTCAIITTPLNYIWQKNLEATFPGTRPRDAAPKHEIKPGRSDTETSKPALNVTNTVTKIIIDQTIGGTWNTVLFLLTMGLLRGEHHELVFAQIREVSLLV